MKGGTGQLFTAAYWIEFWRHATENLLRTALQVAAIVIAYFIVSAVLTRLLNAMLSRLASHSRADGGSSERAGRISTLQSLCKSSLAYLLTFIFGVTLLKAIGFDIMPFITTASVIGLAVGFGSQKLIKDVISGFFIIVDDLFDVGDTVSTGGVTGRVQEIGMRVTRLVDASGRIVILANGDIGTLTNLSRNPIEEFVEVALAASADLSRAIQAINAAGAKLYEQADHKLRAAPQVLGVSAISAASVTLRVSVVTDPANLPAEQMRLRGALRDALAAAEIPLA
ncbi:MAG TPA: mechanosensitive ion channel family protein [Chthonomonadaceae bacterium]|nr:mechanosensitive ion channel family protein [Chthonomonadaceae bacterium]